jgi:hypothetical protein
MAKQPANVAAAPTAYRIFFASENVASDAAVPAEKQAAVFRRFADPRPQLAYRQTVPLDELLGKDGKQAPPASELWVVHLPDGVPAAQAEKLHRWLGRDAVTPLAAESDELGLFWRPGQALIEADPELVDEALAALTDFAFYEGQLQKLEDEVAERWPELEADMPYVSKIDGGQRKIWNVLYGRLEHQHRLGMLSTRVERQTALLTQKRPKEVRKLLARLLGGARVRTRFEQLNNQLEVRDAVYDQIGYRLSDHRGFRSSLVIEIFIVVLLLAEVGLSLFNLLAGEG